MKESQIIEHVDKAIADLVYDKTELIKAYNYYNCYRDPDQFRHLEENFGLGTPTQIEFTPLIRKHIDALVGEYMSLPIDPRISCKDEKTLSNIQRDKQLEIKKQVFNYYSGKLVNSIMSLFGGKQDSNNQDPVMIKEIEKLKEDIDLNFVSEYEMAAQNIISLILQSRDFDFRTKLTTLVRDLFVGGCVYYQATPNKDGDNFNYEILNPIHTFVDTNPNETYIKNSYRAVVRRYMSKDEILLKYGNDLSQEAIDELESQCAYRGNSGNIYYVRSQDLDGNPMHGGIVAGLEVMPGLPNENRETRFNHRLFEVCEVQWLQADKEDGEWIENLYEGVRINTTIYIPKGKNKDATRSARNKSKTQLTVNGLFFAYRSGQPFSLVGKTQNLQDKYDILHFYRDNLIASSGTKGDWIDVSMLPSFLGEDLTERLQKFAAYKKQMGMAIIDTSQEGRAFNNNTTFAGYDDTLQAGLMQAFDYAIQSIENTCSSITGVSRERLANGINQRDAVNNVEVGVKMSAIVTKHYSQMLDSIVKEMITDGLNLAKRVYKKGLTGTLTLGENRKQIFTALPEHFTVTDYDIHVNDSAEVNKDMESIKQFVQSMIQAGIVTADVAVEAIDSKSMTDLKTSVKKSIAKQKEEMGENAQLKQQLEQSQQQIQQAQQQLQQMQQELAKAQEQSAGHQIEQEKLQIEWYKAKNDKKYKDDTIDTKEQLIQAEVAQLYDGNAKNDEIKNI